MLGERFRRTMNAFAARYYFERFVEEYNLVTLQNALRALMAHIIYYEGESHASSIGMREIYHDFLEVLPVDIRDEFEQEELDDEESITLRADLIKYLKNLKKTDDDHVMVNGKSYKRDNKTLSVIKKLRGFACQLCGITILKRNGKFYIEAAHIKARSQSGRETPDNILILCPNHHKEFDHGTTEITLQNSDMVEFTMNGVSYSVSLVIE